MGPGEWWRYSLIGHCIHRAPGGGVTMITKCSPVFGLPMIHYRYLLHTLMFDQTLHVSAICLSNLLWITASCSLCIWIGEMKESQCKCGKVSETESIDKHDARESSDWDKRSHSRLGSMSKLLLQLPHYHNLRTAESSILSREELSHWLRGHF